MKDGIIKGTGDSRYLKGAGWPSTYAEFKAMAEAGTLPFDLNGINAAGWQQIGTALNKGNLFSDEAKAKYAASNVPTDAFKILGNALVKQGSQIKDPLGNLVTIPSVQLDSRTQIATGSYQGTGSYGVDNPTRIVTPFTAKLLIVYSMNTFMRDRVSYPSQLGWIRMVVWGLGMASTQVGGGYPEFEQSGQTISIVSAENSGMQLNYHEILYGWVALG